MNTTGVSLIFTSNIIGTFFPYKFLLIDRQVANLHMALTNNSKFNVKLSETKISKITQSYSFLGKRLGPLLNIWLTLAKNVLTS